MSVLRLRGTLSAPSAWEWSLDGGRVSGQGALSEPPQYASRVELVLPASDVTIARTQLPPGARRRDDRVLAYAVEDETLGDPDAQRACWLGTSAGADVLAVVDRAAYAQIVEALDRAGLRADDVFCETLLLPRLPMEWSVWWDGREGFVRTGELEGAVTDAGDARIPPLALHLLLKEAAAAGSEPSAVAVYVAEPGAAPDIAAWEAALRIPVRLAGSWDWRSAAAEKHARLALRHGKSPRVGKLMARLKTAAWIAGATIALHAAALAIDWGVLSTEQRSLRGQLEARFRAVFPEAVAVADPALQMRRRLADARHAAGMTDPDDFLPALARAAPAVLSLPPGALRALSYESGMLTVHLNGVDDTTLRTVMSRLADAGVTVVRRSRASADGIVVLTLGGA